MSKERKPDIRRGEVAFIFAIALGLILGFLIKRIRIGILVGMVLGFLIVLAGFNRSGRR